MMKRLILTGFGMLAALGANATLKTWDVDDYVQDGLIVHYDAIRNVGANLPHDSTATSWVDISPSGAGGAATEKLAVDGQERGAWTDIAYSTSGWTYMQMANAIALGLEFTVQVACDIDKSYYKTEIDSNKNYPSPFACGEFGFYLDRTYESIRAKTNLNWKTDDYSSPGYKNNRPSMNWVNGNYINAAMDYSNMYFTVADTWPTAKAKTTPGISIPALTYTFGGRSGRDGGNCTLGKYHSVRIYSRKLTNDEMKWNRTLDEMRFFGANILPVTNVIVMADALGRTGAEPAGMYTVDGSHIFSAGNVTTNGNTYEIAGYMLSQWDAGINDWGNAVFHSGATYEHVVSASQPKVRLAWIWHLATGIERLDVTHYVQDGLIANYDGIRNLGAHLPHSSSGKEWIDTVGGSSATLKETTSGTDYGEWTDSGYRFDGYSYFEAGNKITLGSEFTVQLVNDAEMSDIDDLHSYHVFWANGEFSIYLDRSYATAIAATNIYWKDDLYANAGGRARPYFSWKGKYLSASMDATYSYLAETPYWINQQPNRREHIAEITPVPALKYTWGGRFTSKNTAAACTRGVFYAWRAYSRKLTDAELAWNRDVDEVRFRGALPTTMSNAVVVVSAHNSFSAAEDGVYALGGSYTFTASQQRLGNSVYSPKYAVETWNNATKEWVRTTEAESDRCVLNEADGTAPRRIVWKWRKEGFSLILR